MGAFAYLKFLAPLATDILKELLLPGAGGETEKKTTVLERLCILIILALCTMLFYAGDQLFSMNTAKIKAESTVASLLDKNTGLTKRVTDFAAELNKANAIKCEAPSLVVQPAMVKSDPIPIPAIPKNKSVKNRHRMIYDKLNGKG